VTQRPTVPDGAPFALWTRESPQRPELAAKPCKSHRSGEMDTWRAGDAFRSRLPTVKSTFVVRRNWVMPGPFNRDSDRNGHEWTESPPNDCLSSRRLSGATGCTLDRYRFQQLVQFDDAHGFREIVLEAGFCGLEPIGFIHMACRRDEHGVGNQLA
jgi:hypothetical protein